MKLDRVEGTRAAGPGATGPVGPQPQGPVRLVEVQLGGAAETFREPAHVDDHGPVPFRRGFRLPQDDRVRAPVRVHMDATVDERLAGTPERTDVDEPPLGVERDGGGPSLPAERPLLDTQVGGGRVAQFEGRVARLLAHPQFALRREPEATGTPELLGSVPFPAEAEEERAVRIEDTDLARPPVDDQDPPQRILGHRGDATEQIRLVPVEFPDLQVYGSFKRGDIDLRLRGVAIGAGADRD